MTETGGKSSEPLQRSCYSSDNTLRYITLHNIMNYEYPNGDEET